MNDLVIREAAEDDLPAILDLYRAAGLDGESSFSVEEARAQLVLLQSYPCFRLFVAQIDSQAGGSMIVGTYELVLLDNMAKHGRKSGVVEDVAVHPDHQGQGVGRTLMKHALEQCRAAGCYKLTLSSNLKRTAAHRFYEALGFEKHGYSLQVEM